MDWKWNPKVIKVSYFLKLLLHWINQYLKLKRLFLKAFGDRSSWNFLLIFYDNGHSFFTGGGALLKGLDKRFPPENKASDSHCWRSTSKQLVLGTGTALKNVQNFRTYWWHKSWMLRILIFLYSWRAFYIILYLLEVTAICVDRRKPTRLKGHFLSIASSAIIGSAIKEAIQMSLISFPCWSKWSSNYWKRFLACCT